MGLFSRKSRPWNPNRFSNQKVLYEVSMSDSGGDSDDGDWSSGDGGGEGWAGYGGAGQSQGWPPMYNQGVTPIPPQVTYDPGARQLQQVDAGTRGMYYAPQAQSVFNIQTNPVQYLDTRLPMPTITSPVRMLSQNAMAPPHQGYPHAQHQQQRMYAPQQPEYGYGQANPSGAAKTPAEKEELCCALDIPSKELRQVREDLGAEIADFSRWGVGAGAGVKADLSIAPESGTQDIINGPVAISHQPVKYDVYDQGFVSLSSVPVVYAGKYKDPLTGVEYDAYESAMPPPDDDYEETLNNPARNVALARLQGGWTDNTPKPTRTEMVEDDFHMQYDRTINTYGTYDDTRWRENAERNNRFVRNDDHPDPDGPTNVDQLPANADGNQGNVKVRHMPYVKPTHRGKWAETTFRDGINPNVAVGNHQSMVAQTFTKFPCARAESNRTDGGGMEVTANTSAPMDMQIGYGRRDIMPTQRSTFEQSMPHQGPVNFVRLASNTGMEVHEAPTGYNGTVVADDSQFGAYGATVEANSWNTGAYTVEAPTGYNGTYVADILQGGVQPNGGDNASGQMNARAPMLRSQQYEPQHKVTGTQYLDTNQMSGVQVANGAASKVEAKVTRFNTKKGVHSDVMQTAAAFGGAAEGQMNQAAVTKLNTKNEMGRQFVHGAYGGPESQAQQLLKTYHEVDALTKREGQQPIYVGTDTTYGHQTAQQVVGATTRFSTKKGPMTDFLMPSGSIGGTDGLVSGVPGYSAVTNLSTKRDKLNDQPEYGFAPNVYDGALWLGHYDQTMEHLNSRIYGNMEHMVAPAGAALFLTQLECES